MEPADNDIGEKARTIATVFGDHKNYNKFYFVGDTDSISDLNYAMDNIEEWVKKTDELSIEYSRVHNKEYSAEQVQIQAKWFWFLKKTIYYARNGQVTCKKLGAWKDKINDLYLLASRRGEWRKEITQLKKEMRIA